jgi:hypothetical protein
LIYSPANELVLKDETHYFDFTSSTWLKITASSPDSDEIYITLTNQMTVSLGSLNQCRWLRWNIEKASRKSQAGRTQSTPKSVDALYRPTE